MRVTTITKTNRSLICSNKIRNYFFSNKLNRYDIYHPFTIIASAHLHQNNDYSSVNMLASFAEFSNNPFDKVFRNT
jgi:hypothetical protein